MAANETDRRHSSRGLPVEHIALTLGEEQDADIRNLP